MAWAGPLSDPHLQTAKPRGVELRLVSIFAQDDEPNPTRNQSQSGGSNPGRRDRSEDNHHDAAENEHDSHRCQEIPLGPLILRCPAHRATSLSTRSAARSRSRRPESLESTRPHSHLQPAFSRATTSFSPAKRSASGDSASNQSAPSVAAQAIASEQVGFAKTAWTGARDPPRAMITACPSVTVPAPSSGSRLRSSSSSSACLPSSVSTYSVPRVGSPRPIGSMIPSATIRCINPKMEPVSTP